MPPKTIQDQQATELTEGPRSTDTHEPTQDARRIYGVVLARHLGGDVEAEYEGKVLSTPGVLDAMDSALDELEAMKRNL